MPTVSGRGFDSPRLHWLQLTHIDEQRWDESGTFSFDAYIGCSGEYTYSESQLDYTSQVISRDSQWTDDSGVTYVAHSDDDYWYNDSYTLERTGTRGRSSSSGVLSDSFTFEYSPTSRA